MGLTPVTILQAPLLAITRWKPRQTEQQPVEERPNGNLPVRPSHKGWWGFQPSLLDKVFLGIFLLFIAPGMLGTAAAADIIKQKILDYIFLPQGDLIVTGYGFGLFAAFFLGILVTHGAFDITTEIIMRLLKKTTGKTTQQLIPALYGQSQAMGLDVENPWRWRKFLYGKVGAVLLIVALFGAMGGYTRFTDTEIIHCGWPGFTEKRYTYDDIIYIWDVESERTHDYAVEFYDGWLWKTNYLSPDFLHDRPKTDINTDGGYIITYLLEKTGLSLTEGETY